MRSVGRPVERGFSMVELMVAMTATLVVSGAVYGLVVAGNSAFRREPALADRQQNIRVALDVIGQDVFRAGYGLPAFAQAFTDGLDALGPVGSSGEPTDELEIFAAADCSILRVCALNTMGTAASVTTFQRLSACYKFPVLVFLGGDQLGVDQEKYGVYWAEQPGTGETGSCESGGGGDNGHVVLPHGQEPIHNPPGGLAGWLPHWMLAGQVIRYRIQADAGGTPELQRSEVGGRLLPDGSSSWQTIARGIEDLQVEYETGAPDWQDTPGLITCEPNCAAPAAGEYARLVRRVRVTLSARALEANLAGQRTSAVGNAVRGQLSTDIAPRAANTTLQMSAGEL
jgi:prepilin-type N-terminal cleavage/methylation domain-containing protein